MSCVIFFIKPRATHYRYVHFKKKKKLLERFIRVTFHMNNPALIFQLALNEK